MIAADLHIQFDSEWLVAGGPSTLGTADLAPMLDGDGLPFIPGRTLRGLLREAVLTVDIACGRADSNCDRLFGTRKSTESQGAGDGSTRIGDALLPRAIAERCRLREDRCDLLHTTRRTSLELGTRVAKARSLREMEVAIAGLCLSGPVECSSREDLELLAFAGGLIRHLGHSRSRGLGRCQFWFTHGDRKVDGTSLPRQGGGRLP